MYQIIACKGELYKHIITSYPKLAYEKLEMIKAGYKIVSCCSVSKPIFYNQAELNKI